MKKASISALISTFIVCFLFWILITGELADALKGKFSVEVFIAGILVCAVVSAFSARFFIHEDSKSFHLFHPGRLLKFLAYCLITFPIELFKANIDMAAKAFTPGIKNKIHPGIVKVPVDLKSEYALAMLANSITLTPGTITMDLAEDTEEDNQLYYYIHWIDVKSTDHKAAGEMIKGTMEKGLKGVWE